MLDLHTKIFLMLCIFYQHQKLYSIDDKRKILDNNESV